MRSFPTKREIALAQEGGIGIVHKNLTPREQAAEVAKVKRYESGVVSDPITIGPDLTVRDVIEITREHKISGLPVVEGAPGSPAAQAILGIAERIHASRVQDPVARIRRPLTVL